MADLIEMGKQRVPALMGMSTIEKAQLAVQIAAFVRASFSKPTDSDVRELLAMAASQLSAPLHDGSV